MMVLRVAEPYRSLISARTFEALETALSGAYSPSAARREIVSQLSDNYNAEAIRACEWWFRSELGTRVAQQELAAGTPEGARLMEAYSRELAGQAPSEEQLIVAEGYDRATRKSSLLALTLYLMTKAVVDGLTTAVPEAERLPADRVALELDALRENLPRVFRGTILSMLLYMEKDLSPEERKEMLAFVESDSAQWLFENYAKGLELALRSSQAAFLERFEKRLSASGQ